MDTVEPDGKGRIPLRRFTKKVADEYQVSVTERGVVILTPTEVQAAALAKIEAMIPNFADRLDEAVASGSHPSDLWKQLDEHS